MGDPLSPRVILPRIARGYHPERDTPPAGSRQQEAGNAAQAADRRCAYRRFGRNLCAQRFYQNDLWSPDGLRRTDSVWGIAVDVLRFQRNL